MNNRVFTRIKVAEWATITYANQTFGGMVENLSLRGLFIQTNQRIPMNIPIDISVHHTLDKSMDFNATVVRHTASGLGIRINRMDIHSLIHLKGMLSDHYNDPDMAMQETKMMVGCMLGSQ